MNRKTIAVSLVALTALAAVMGAVAMSSFAAADTNSTTSDPTTVTAQDSSGNQPMFSANMMGEQGFGGMQGGRGHGCMNGMGAMGNLEVSSEYNATVNTILSSDTDVQTLLTQGYSVKAIQPIVHNIIEGDGTIATKASTAMVILENGTHGYSIVNVDIANAKVTQITTTTVIDKSSS